MITPGRKESSHSRPLLCQISLNVALVHPLVEYRLICTIIINKLREREGGGIEMANKYDIISE